MKKYFFIIFAIFILSAPFYAAHAQNFEKLFYLSPAKEKTGIESIKKNHQKIDILAPQVYGVTASLKVVGGPSKNLRAVIKDYNLKVMPLLANGGFSQTIIHNLLKSPSAQDKIIDFLVNEAKSKSYIGWQFDFENISYKDRALFSAFVEKTGKKLKENSLLFSVAAVSRIVDYENTDAYLNWSGAFDYKKIADATDFVSLMTYDDNNSIGPSSSLFFVDSVLDYVKDKIPASKLSMGIPLYYWGWTIKPYKRIRSGGSYARITGIKTSTAHISGFVEALGVSWLSYAYKTERYLIWYEDKKSFGLKLDIVKNNKFRGFSAWVLGDEDPAIWTALSK